MKYAVLTMVGVWFAFVSVAKSFHAVNALLLPNHFSAASLFIVLIATLFIGFGYTMFLIALLDAYIPRRKTIAITIASAFFIFILFVLEFFLEVKFHTIDLMRMYMSFDMYLRNNHHTVFAWMDFGNTLLLIASMLWWSLTGGILLALHQRRHKKV